MAAEFGAVFHLGFFGIPDSEGTVGGSGGDEVAGGVPGYSADSRERKVSIEGFDGDLGMEMGSLKGGQTYVWEPGPREEGSW